MSDSLIVLGDISVAGLFETLCGVFLALLFLVSGATALAAVGFCFFKRTAQMAFRLGRIGIWTGTMACVVAIVGTLATAKVEPSGTIADAAWTILFTGFIPVVAFVAKRISRRTIQAGAKGEEIEPQKK